MRYRLLLIKRQLEDLAMWPLILLGRMLAKRKPLEKEYDIFFFFPFYHIGGAEKVHYNIAKAIGNKNCIIFFTRKSHNNFFYQEFAASGCELRDISRYTDNKWLYFVNIIFRGIVSGYINSQRKTPAVFNGQCNFGYKLSPWVSKRIPQIELLHSLCSFSYIRIPFLPFITKTVMISTIRIQEHLDLYQRYGIPLTYGKRIQFIMNAIDLPTPKPQAHKAGEQMNVLYVGRSTPEKRVHLIGKMAALLHQQNKNFRFSFLGEVKDAIPSEYHPYCQFYGNQSDQRLIEEIYQQSDVLMLVSDTEGFPMVVMEAMAFGLAIIATSVGELPLHVHEEKNGFLLTDVMNEDVIVSTAINRLLQLKENSELQWSISQQNIAYAYAHFGMNRFITDYRRLIEEVQSNANS